MRLLYDFRCTGCALVSERLVERDVKEVTCRECGSPATRLIPAPRAKLDPISGDFPGATLKWERMHEQANR